MKSANLIATVIATPGKTATELSKITGGPVDQLSSALNRLAKAKRLRRYCKKGIRPSVRAWRYYPAYAIERQEAVLSALHDLMEAQAKNPKPWRCVSRGYNYHPDSVGAALHAIMAIFEIGVASID